LDDEEGFEEQYHP
jgi:hypothetical protein